MPLLQIPLSIYYLDQVWNSECMDRAMGGSMSNEQRQAYVDLYRMPLQPLPFCDGQHTSTIGWLPIRFLLLGATVVYGLLTFCQ